LKILIEKGAQLDALTDSKRSPLEIAISHNSEKCVGILIQSGCNINLKVCYSHVKVNKNIYNSKSCLIINRIPMEELRWSKPFTLEGLRLSSRCWLLPAGLTGT